MENYDVNDDLYYQEPEPKDKKGFAVASLCLGIGALITFCFWPISVISGILALVFGFLSVNSSGRGMAIAGIVLGAIGAIIAIILVAFVLSAGSFFEEFEGFMQQTIIYAKKTKYIL